MRMSSNSVKNNFDENESKPDKSKILVEDDVNDKHFQDCCDDPEVIKTSPPNDDTDDDRFSDARAECSDEEELELDEEFMKENHKGLSDEDIEKLKEEAASLKTNGNECFKKAEYKESISFYTAALNKCPLKYQSDRSILYANRAAARIGLEFNVMTKFSSAIHTVTIPLSSGVRELNEEAVLDCNKAIELNPNYLKAVLRRAQLHRKMDSPEKALEDYKRVLELDPNNSEARQACVTLPPEIAERNERLKNEMFGKLKELGNLCLRPFGLSTDNFQVVQDPNSGGYSVNFQNNTS